MGDSVPDWEDVCGATEIATSLDSLDHLLKEKWENVELSSQITNFTSLSEHDIHQGSWGNRTCSPCLKGASVEQSDPQDEACPWQVEDSVSQLQPAHEIILSAGKKTVNSVQGGADDEMVSWLQYPLVDALDKEYYQALSGCNLPCAKDLFVERTGWDFHLRSKVAETKSGAWSNDPVKVAALSSGSGDARRSEVEVLNTISVPQVAVKMRPCAGSPPNLAFPAWSPPRTAASASQNQSSGVSAQVDLLSENATMLNFPHFSRPAALVKANLQSLGVTSGAISQSRPRQNICSTGSAFPAASIPSSSRFDSTALSCPTKTKMYQESPHHLRGKETESIIEQRSGSTENVSLTSHHKIQGSTAICASSYFSASQECDASQQAVTYDAPEAILGSSTGGSSSSVARGERASMVSVKRKMGEEDSLCPGGGPEDESLDTKQTFVVRSSATKRSRAAEVHNLSERVRCWEVVRNAHRAFFGYSGIPKVINWWMFQRRRDRINEKMRALQDLIPNSNKTDKASMLDEAIEYLKMLQLHIQGPERAVEHHHSVHIDARACDRSNFGFADHSWSYGLCWVFSWTVVCAWTIQVERAISQDYPVIISMRSGISIPSMILPPGSQQLRTCFSRPDPLWDLTLRGATCEGSGMGLGSINVTDPRQGVSSLSTPTKIMVGISGDGQLQSSARVDSCPRQDVQVICHASEICHW